MWRFVELRLLGDWVDGEAFILEVGWSLGRLVKQTVD